MPLRGEGDLYDLAVIGMGPKAAALLAKSAAIAHLGAGRVRVVVLEASAPGAFWTGAHGFTSGEERLGTRPEKDVGFPYASETTFGELGKSINSEMLKFSWLAFLIDESRVADWVDSSCPVPEHSALAEYIAWVARHTTDVGDLFIESVVGLQIVDDHWRVNTERGDIGAKGVLISGPGQVVRLPPKEFTHARLIDSSVSRPRLAALLSGLRGKAIAVVGGGESAASVSVFVNKVAPSCRITLYAPDGIRTREETRAINALYSDGGGLNWSRKSLEERELFIGQSDRGVVSPALVEQLSAIGSKLVVVEERVSAVSVSTAEAGLVELESTAGQRRAFDLVVNATGFDPWTQIQSLCAPGILKCRKERMQPRDERYGVNDRLAVVDIYPSLYMPSLAGPAVGPGFPNLSCLGRMSDIVIADVLAAQGGDWPSNYTRTGHSMPISQPRPPTRRFLVLGDISSQYAIVPSGTPFLVAELPISEEGSRAIELCSSAATSSEDVAVYASPQFRNPIHLELAKAILMWDGFAPSPALNDALAIQTAYSSADLASLAPLLLLRVTSTHGAKTTLAEVLACARVRAGGAVFIRVAQFEFPDDSMFSDVLAESVQQLAARRQHVNSESEAFTRFEEGIEIENKLTLLSPISAWAVARSLATAVRGGDFHPFVCDLGYELTRWESRQDFFEVLSPPEDVGYISITAVSPGESATVKHKRFQKDAKRRSEEFHVVAAPPPDHVGSFIAEMHSDLELRRLPSYSRVRFDVNVESVSSGHGFGIEVDEVVVDESEHVLRQVELEYAHSRIHDGLDGESIDRDLEALTQLCIDSLDASNIAFERTYYSKLSFLRDITSSTQRDMTSSTETAPVVHGAPRQWKFGP